MIKSIISRPQARAAGLASPTVNRKTRNKKRVQWKEDQIIIILPSLFSSSSSTTTATTKLSLLLEEDLSTHVIDYNSSCHGDNCSKRSYDNNHNISDDDDDHDDDDEGSYDLNSELDARPNFASSPSGDDGNDCGIMPSVITLLNETSSSLHNSLNCSILSFDDDDINELRSIHYASSSNLQQHQHRTTTI